MRLCMNERTNERTAGRTDKTFTNGQSKKFIGTYSYGLGLELLIFPSYMIDLLSLFNLKVVGAPRVPKLARVPSPAAYHVRLS